MQGLILSAGQGSRLLPLTAELPKCLVEVAGRAILDHQLAALAAAGLSSATVIAGYRFTQVAEHLAAGTQPLSVTLLFNPFWQVASSISSVWRARDRLDEPFCLLNGDTVFDAEVIAAAIGRASTGVSLLIEPLGEHEPDDMLVAAADGRVQAVAKALPPAHATHRSLGVVLVRDDGGAYARALEATIAAPDGIHAFHHAIVDRLAREGGVAALERASGRWQEIDRPADIDRWRREHA